MSVANSNLDRALRLHNAGQLPEAIRLYKKALKRQERDPQVLFLLGTACFQFGQKKDGIKYVQESIGLIPNPIAYNNLGTMLVLTGEPESGIAAFDKAIAIETNYAEAYCNKAAALEGLMRHQESLQCCNRAIELEANYPLAYLNQGNAYQSLRKFDEAMVSYDHALQLIPAYAEAFLNRSAVLRKLGGPYDALESSARAIALKPDYAEAYNAQGNAQLELGRFAEALQSYDKAIEIKPEYPESFWNKSLLLLMQGFFLEGWSLYEWRRLLAETKWQYYKFSKPEWCGKDSIQGKRLMIYAEQGLGDTIHFCRYLPLLCELGARVVFEVPECLAELVSTLKAPLQIVARGHPVPEFDAYCPLMSLPLALKTTVETIPADIPYLWAEANKIAEWEARIGQEKKLRVGLAWSGSSSHNKDVGRSVPLKTLLSLASLPIELHSLQKEYRDADLIVLETAPNIHQHQDLLNDFSDTAALAACMDVIISVDTSVAHLAGALGKQTFVMLPLIPDFRWMLDRNDSPWYPSAKLFRQLCYGDWESVVHAIKEQLNQLLCDLGHPAPRHADTKPTS